MCRTRWYLAASSSTVVPKSNVSDAYVVQCQPTIWIFASVEYPACWKIEVNHLHRIVFTSEWNHQVLRTKQWTSSLVNKSSDQVLKCELFLHWICQAQLPKISFANVFENSIPTVKGECFHL